MSKKPRRTVHVDNPDRVTQARTIDLYNHRDRAWMSKHCWWAAHSGHSVTSTPLQEVE